jgi:prepilin-type processing-associated H-X9-DG protein
VLFVTDGTSNTIAFAEAAGRPQTWELGKQVAPDHPPQPPGRRSRIGGWASFSNVLEIAGMNPGIVPAAGSNNFPGPCAVNCDNGQNIYSFHPSGAHILMADGSVQLLKASASLTTVAILLTPDDGLLIPADAF